MNAILCVTHDLVSYHEKHEELSAQHPWIAGAAWVGDPPLVLF